MTAGAYSQNAGLNWGIAATTFKGTYYQGFKGYDRKASKGEISSVGVNLSVGKAFNRAYVGGSLYFNQHSFDNTQHLIDDYYLDSDFKLRTVGLTANADYLLLGNQNSGLEVNGGATLEFHSQSKFKESVNNDTAASFAKNVASRHHTTGFVHAGLKGFVTFNTWGFSSTLDSELKLSQNISSNRFNARLTVGTALANGFDAKFLADLTIGYSINISPSFNIRLAGGYTVGSNWSNTKANLSLRYGF
ncbi:hypothetical protein [Psittacicella hinzii]|uniref:Autotransporter domain-containing protein n=1 Tax=Psittacicella hinzii TaxID=2028575 RepID=A0A3A1YF57_9GAMM|nr:hypothetical protein [Psittacicella hinzii]RIY36191.1 hypothetical protein CKF58_06170 [Psittacicella hinzii]